MKVSLSWLRQYVPSALSAQELSHRLTMAGLEVEGIDAPGRGLEGVVVAEILASARHPNADKLSVTKVNIGAEAPLQIVCGAKNFRVGDRVPLATVGTRLPGGGEIQAAELRGVQSFGMLCSARELKLSEDGEGLMILDRDAPVGAPLARALGLDEVVLEVNVTPNRPDALSHVGVAREVSALTGERLVPPEVALLEGPVAVADAVKIRVDDPERCPRYLGRVIEGVTIAPSPVWLQQRLKACGVRPINNVVDVTNFVLLEYGQPLHAFDLDRLARGQVIVRPARAGERLTTLDGKERTLVEDDLVICDAERPQALAGVMGGADAEVSATTRRILLEVACFEPSGIRRMSKRHALHTEASHRFERGTDIESVAQVAERAAAMIADLSGGVVRRGAVDVYPRPYVPKVVELRLERLSALLGVDVPEEDVQRILSQLGFTLTTRTVGRLTYRVPAWRVDVEREEDLVEEVARVHGYDRVPLALPTAGASLAPESSDVVVERRLREALAGTGFDEVMNYSFVSRAELAACGEGPEPIGLENPLSAEQEVMRTTLLTGLFRNVANARRHQVDAGRLYELGRAYLRDPEGGEALRPPAREVLRIAGVMFGKRHARTWTEKESAVDFYDAKGAVEALLGSLRLSGTFAPCEGGFLHPRAAAEVRAGGALVGRLGVVHPKVVKAFELPPGTVAFELDLSPLVAAFVRVPQFAGVPRFPSVLRDLAVVVPVELGNDVLRALILEVGAPLVDDASVFDVYSGRPIPEGKKNVAYALRYRSRDRTLTDAEVNEAHERIVLEVNRRLGGSLRGANV